MNQSSAIILTHSQITNKLKRLAWQIFENNMDEGKLWIAGIDERGQFIANHIINELMLITSQNVYKLDINIDRQTFEPKFLTDNNFEDLENAAIIIVDDVLNSGKTIVSSFLPLMNRKVKRFEVAVLASRSHRLYPIRPDYVGISMATTLQEHLKFDNSNPENLLLVLE